MLQHVIIISTLEPVHAESYLALIVRVMVRELAKFQLHHESLREVWHTLLSPPPSTSGMQHTQHTQQQHHHRRQDKNTSLASVFHTS